MTIFHHYSLRSLNTLGVESRAEHFAQVAELDEIRQVWQAARGQPMTVLGAGSNVVLRPFVPGWVLQPWLLGRHLHEETADAWQIRLGAGECWHDVVGWTLDQGWPGLENLSFIPGTVGAAPIQNIGAYGVEFESVFESLTAFDWHTGETQIFRHADCHFAYRDSIFKRHPGRYVITEVILRLPKAWRPCLSYRDVSDALAQHGVTEPSARDISHAVIAVRQRKLPDWRVLGNVGSFFKNPVVSAEVAESLRQRFAQMPTYPQNDGTVKLAAGWLIEQAGWKGRRLGAAGVYERQALVLVNHGGASGLEILALGQAIAAAVREQFGVLLEQEPVVVPQ